MKKKAILIAIIGTVSVTLVALIIFLTGVFANRISNLHKTDDTNYTSESTPTVNNDSNDNNESVSSDNEDTGSLRLVSIIDMDGTCYVFRDGEKIKASLNMALLDGDIVEVTQGFARIMLDEDKLLYLEKGTRIGITATGDAETSKTSIFVERGSVMTEVLNKLSKESTFTVVTANTVMNIRGTKTLTQVLEDAVTGHVQTSNAVLEGQVKIKSVKVKADGTVVSVEKDLGSGEGNSFSSNKEELVSQEEMKSIADTGSDVKGIRVEIVSEEEADIVFDVYTFEASFLENIKNILMADAESKSGEEGLSQEQIDKINLALDEVLKAFEVILAQSEKEIQQVAQIPDPAPEPVFEPTPQTTEDVTLANSYDTVGKTSDTTPQSLNVTTGDGDTNLVGLEEDEEAKMIEKEEADRLAKEEERLAREEEERLAREEEERLAREEAERLAEEEKKKNVKITYEKTAWEIDNSDSGFALRLSFWNLNSETGEFEEIDQEDEYPLPDTLPRGATLPGIETPEGIDMYVFVSKADIVAIDGEDIEVWERSEEFTFTGWYYKDEEEYINIETVPEDEDITELVLYAQLNDMDIEEDEEINPLDD
ncbi:FecR family protein [Lachnospiraceae bacterium G41]|nr:FecR family protein [Lachnospiraceae bacterium G41]